MRGGVKNKAPFKVVSIFYGHQWVGDNLTTENPAIVKADPDDCLINPAAIPWPLLIQEGCRFSILLQKFDLMAFLLLRATDHGDALQACPPSPAVRGWRGAPGGEH